MRNVYSLMQTQLGTEVIWQWQARRRRCQSSTFILFAGRGNEHDAGMDRRTLAHGQLGLRLQPLERRSEKCKYRGLTPAHGTSISRRGHQMKLNMAKANLAKQKALYQANCSDPEPPKSCPMIQPMFAGQPVTPGQAALGAGGAAVLLGGALGGPAGAAAGGLVFAAP